MGVSDRQTQEGRSLQPHQKEEREPHKAEHVRKTPHTLLCFRSEAFSLPDKEPLSTRLRGLAPAPHPPCEIKHKPSLCSKWSLMLLGVEIRVPAKGPKQNHLAAVGFSAATAAAHGKASAAGFCPRR